MRFLELLPPQKRQPGYKYRPAPVNYYAAFDCLNSDTPALIGFVRQPATQRSHVDGLAMHWRNVLDRDKESPCGLLQLGGFDAVSLAVRLRPATMPEIAAYDQVTAKLGMTLAYILRRGHALATGMTVEYMLVDSMPSDLTEATWGGPTSQLLVGYRWWNRGRADLFDFILEMPVPQRSHLLSRLVDLDSVCMHDFAGNTADGLAADSAMLASGVLDVWQFDIDSSGWSAALNADTWVVRLYGAGEHLTIELDMEGQRWAQQLGSTAAKPPATHPYRGRLSSLYNLLEGLVVLRREGRDSVINKHPELASMPPGPYRHRKLVELILHGSGQPYTSLDGTRWPRFKGKFVPLLPQGETAGSTAVPFGEMTRSPI